MLENHLILEKHFNTLMASKEVSVPDGFLSLLVQTGTLRARYRYSRGTLCKHGDTFAVKIKPVNVLVFLKLI